MKHEVSLSELIRAIAADRWTIAFVTAACTAIALAYIANSPEIYRAEALIQLDKQPTNPPPRESSLAQAAAEFDTEQTTTAEISIIESRTVLGDVVDALGLELEITQQPLFAFLPGESTAFFDAPSDQIKISKFYVPTKSKDKSFTLVAKQDGEYSLLDRNGRPLGKGRVGEALKLTLNDGPLLLHVARLEAPPDTKFTLVRKSRTSAVDALQRELSVNEEGKESGLIRLSIEGHNREVVTKIVATAAASYINRHKEWRSAAISETLAFLEAQVPALKANTWKAENALRKFRRQKGAVNLTFETEQLLSRSVDLQNQITIKTRERQSYLPGHPANAALDAEIVGLHKELARVNARMSSLPALQQIYLDLSRTAEINAALYAGVKKNIEELQLIKSASSHEIRLIDPGDASIEPVRPRKALILTLGVAIGLFLGTLFSLVRRFWRGALNGPDGVEELIGIPVYTSLPITLRHHTLAAPQKLAALPHILTHPEPPGAAMEGLRTLRTWIDNSSLKRFNHVFLGLQRVVQPDLSEVAVEGFRSLRSWINSSSFKRSNNVLLVTGATQGVGKTFVSVNLATALATAGRRVLLIDADLRKGNVHCYFGIKPKPGLADLITGEVKDLSKAVHAVGSKPFHLLPTGTPALCRPELLIDPRFAQFLALAGEHYDEVIVDSPPLLAVSDAAVIGQHVGSTLLVVREDMTTASELIEVRKRLEQAGIPLRGVVYNGFTRNLARYSYHYGSNEQQAHTV